LEVCIGKLRKIFTKYGLDKVVREVQKPGSKETITDTRTGYWIHVDGAYGGCYVPYLVQHFKDKPDEVVDTVLDSKGNKVEYKGSQIPSIDMTQFPEICSTVTSGHKFPGAPWPCGVYMSRHKYQLHPPSSPMYIGSMDSTLSGSRNGLSAIIFWKYLSLNSDEKIIEDCLRCLKCAQDIEVRFRKIIDKKNKEKNLDLRLIRGPFGLTLIFSKMREAIRSKYTLA
jgi:histidine decarboxylase